MAHHAVGGQLAAIDQFEGVADKREGLLPTRRRMADGGEHLAQGKRGDLGMALPPAHRADAADGDFDHAHMLQRIVYVRAKADPARALADHRRAMARIIGDAKACERPQGIIIGAVIARPERDRRGRACGHQCGAGIVEDLALLLEREVGEVLTGVL
jgi:hypothetical protein